MLLLLAQSLEKVASTTEVLPFFQALCVVLGTLVALFFGMWQREVSARWTDRERERDRLLALAQTFRPKGGKDSGDDDA